MNYPAVDKQAYAIFKAVKQFRPYILKNRTKVIVPHPAVRSLFVQKELGERRGNWVTTLQEYFNTLVLTPFALNIHDVINRGEELKAKSPPSIWLCMFRQ